MTTQAAGTVQPQLEVEPRRAPVDVPVAVRLAGLPQGERVTVGARMTDALGQRWSSHATFVADSAGTVDLATTAPLSGTWSDADPMGLFWSMERDPAGPAIAPVPLAGPAPLSIEVRAEVGGTVVASTVLERLLVPDGVTVEEVREGGLVG